MKDYCLLSKIKIKVNTHWIKIVVFAPFYSFYPTVYCFVVTLIINDFTFNF